MTHWTWGEGWPNCNGGEIDYAFVVDGIAFPGGVHSRIAELVTRLVRETRNRGYEFGTVDDPSFGCWGYACRSISGSSSPSNHSWGLALDINAPTNPQCHPLTTDMPAWLPDLWNEYGWRWGGDYATSAPDAMHFEFMGSTDDADMQTQRAREARLGEELAVLHTYVDATPTGAVVAFMGETVNYDRITGAWCSDPRGASSWHMIRGLDPTLAVVYADPPARVDIAFV